MTPIFGKVYFFGKLGRVVCLHTQRNCSILHSYQAIFVFCIFEKKSKIQNDRKFWRVKYLLKLGKASLHRYPVNFYFTKRMVSKSTHISLSIVLNVYLMSLYSNFVFCIFCEKFEN